jgi:hypothetical protein
LKEKNGIPKEFREQDEIFKLLNKKNGQLPRLRKTWSNAYPRFNILSHEPVRWLLKIDYFQRGRGKVNREDFMLPNGYIRKQKHTMTMDELPWLT